MTEGSGGRHAAMSVTIGHAPVAHHEAHIVWGGQPGRLEAMQGPNIINVPEGVVLDTFDDAPGTNGTRHLDAVVSGGDPGRLVAMQGPNVIDVPEAACKTPSTDPDTAWSWPRLHRAGRPRSAAPTSGPPASRTRSASSRAGSSARGALRSISWTRGVAPDPTRFAEPHPVRMSE